MVLQSPTETAQGLIHNFSCTTRQYTTTSYFIQLPDFLNEKTIAFNALISVSQQKPISDVTENVRPAVSDQ